MPILTITVQAERSVSMEEHIGQQNRKKLKYLLIPAGIILVSYLFFRYLFPLVWPLVVSMLLALMVYPLVNFFEKKIRINRMISTVLLLLLFVFLIGAGLVFVLQKLLQQVQMLADNYEYYEDCMSTAVTQVCCKVEETFGIQDGSVVTMLNDGINDFFGKINRTVMKFVLGISIPAVRSMIDAVIAAAVMIVTFFLFVKDMEKIKRWAAESVIGKELRFFYRRFCLICRAYIRAQLIIMVVVAAVSVAGLMLAGNKYAWIVGISVGVLDALPLFGAGLILIPLTIVAVIQSKLTKAAILFTAFIACYFAREFLEPKLMGEKTGVGALPALAGIYVGYRLFGFIGMFAGIFTVMVLFDIMKRLGQKDL